MTASFRWMVLAVSAGMLVACGQLAADVERSADEQTCQPVFNRLGHFGDVQFYRLSFQLVNCLPYDVPLSVDVGTPAGSGVPLGNPIPNQAAPGGDVPGAGVSWDSNDGNGPTVPPPAVVPAAGGSGAGRMVGFTTVPYWDGYQAGQSGPCANSVVASDGSGTLNPSAQCEVQTSSVNPDAKLLNRSDFLGSWAVFTPTGTLQAYVGTPGTLGGATGQMYLDGFPYVAAYSQSPDVSNRPGAIATGIMLQRRSVDGEPVPFYYSKTRSAPEGSRPYSQGPPSLSPPVGDFVPGLNCLGELVTVNGQDAPADPVHPTQQSVWNSLIAEGPHKWYLTTVYAEQFAADQPTLFFLKGWQGTSHGQTSTLGLLAPGSPSQALALKPHTFQTYLQDNAHVTCNAGSQKVQIVGGTVNSLDVSTATLESPLILNSTIRYANFNNTTTSGSAAVKNAMAYTLILPGDNGSGDTAAPSRFLNADLSNMNLMGSVFGRVGLVGEHGKYAASIKNSNLAYADLTDAVTNGVSQVGIIRCGTLLPRDQGLGSPQDDMDDECNQLPGAAQWSIRPAAGCSQASCAYISLYNNTTRFLSLGNQICKDGDALTDLRAPAVIAPLDTAQLSFGPSGQQQGKTNVNCSFTYANGPWGKIRVEVSNDKPGRTIKVTADSGLCQAAPGIADGCLPAAAPARLSRLCPVHTDTPSPSPSPTAKCMPIPADKAPGLWPPARADGAKVRFDTAISTKGQATWIDIAMCEPEAYVSGKCSRTPALPRWDTSPSAKSFAAGVPAGSASAARLGAAEQRVGQLGLRIQVSPPVPAGVAYSAVRDSSHQYGYLVTSHAGDVLGRVYTAAGLDPQQLRASVRRAAGSEATRLPGAGNGDVFSWSTPDGQAIAARVTDTGSLITVTARTTGDLLRLSPVLQIEE